MLYFSSKQISRLVLALLVLISSCSSQVNKEVKVNEPVNVVKQETIQHGVVIPSITVHGNPSLSYALYIPSNWSANKKWPVLIFFDAQSRGKLPLELYKEAAEHFGYILMGSNDSHNGNEQSVTNNIINGMLEEVMHNYSIDTARIYTGGFSGGARIALMAAMNNKIVKGVIAVAAGMPSKELPSHDFRIISIAGKQDFNYGELTRLDNELAVEGRSHFLFTHKGKHDWCPQNFISSSLALFNSDAMRNKVIPNNSASYDSLSKSHLFEAEKLKQQNNLTGAASELHYIYELDNGLTDNKKVASRITEIENSDPYKQQLAEEKALLVTEEQSTGIYMQSIGRELSWWEAEINNINKNIEKSPESEHAYMLRRVLASVSVQCYMITQQLMPTNEIQKKEYIISLYKLVDPSNKDPWFFSAVLNAGKGNNPEAVNDLNHSIKNGFNDRNRLLSEAAFGPLQSLPEFRELVEKISY